MILGENGEKMSKSRGNVVNPDEIVNAYGADTMRLYEMFIGDFEKAAPWSSTSIKGCNRFLDRVWALQELEILNGGYSKELESSFHKTIRKVTDDIESLGYNTAIAALMALLNEIYDIKKITEEELKTYLILLNPFAPHISEEIWKQKGFGGMLTSQEWPKYDDEKCKDDVVELAVQVNGKIRARIEVSADESKDSVLKLARNMPELSPHITGKQVAKEIYVPGKLINFVVK